MAFPFPSTFGGMAGTAASSGIFGNLTTPASSAGGLWGGTTGSLFPAAPASSSGLFGTAAATWGAPASSVSLWGAASSGGLFGTTATWGAQASSASLWGRPAGAFPQPGLPGVAGMPGMPGYGAPAAIPLVKTDNTPISYSTPWSELGQQTQTELLKREQTYRETREPMRVLAASERLKDSVDKQKGLENELSLLSTNLKALATQLEADAEQGKVFRGEVSKMLMEIEAAVNLFIRVKTRQENPEYNHMPPMLPDQFLEGGVVGLEVKLSQYLRMVEELENLLAPAMQASSLGHAAAGSAHSIPQILSNLHDFFVHVSAKVEAVHERTQAAREAHLRGLRAAGDHRDPFAEADKAEQAQRLEASLLSAARPPDLVTTPAPITSIAPGPVPVVPAVPPASTMPAQFGGLSSTMAAQFGGLSSTMPSFTMSPAPSLTPGLSGFGAASGGLLGATGGMPGFGTSTAAAAPAAAPAWGAGQPSLSHAFSAATLPTAGLTSGTFGFPATAANPNKQNRGQKTGKKK